MNKLQALRLGSVAVLAVLATQGAVRGQSQAKDFRLVRTAKDVAVVVGVMDYPNLNFGGGSGNPKPQGSANDALLMTQVLPKYGFEVVSLVNREATLSNVMAALREAQGRAPTGRFIFYFSGLGTRSLDGPVLLPSDATDGAGGPELSAKELRAEILKVPAANRTVMLDCNYSGLMAQAKGLRAARGLRTRFYQRRGQEAFSASKGISSGDDGLLVSSSQGKICYVTAATAEGQAYETDEGARPHGIFTLALGNRLQDRKAGELWGRVHTDVAVQVGRSSDNLQMPQLSPDYSSVEVFGGKQDVTPPPPPQPEPISLEALFAMSRPDPNKITLAVVPQKAPVRVREDYSLRAIPGIEGYMVILCRGSSGRFYRLFPFSGRVDDARVAPFRDVRFPDQNDANLRGKSLASDREGEEIYKVILFTSGNRSQAAEVLRHFPGLNRAAMSGDPVLQEPVEVTLDAYYTAVVTVPVRN